ncbi:MAG: hypothetical protein ACOX35_06200 [Bacillota bacterium]
MRTLEDELWVYFGCPNRYWRDKCAACREKVGRFKGPVAECIDCWKVEIWGQSPWLLDAMGSHDSPRGSAHHGRCKNHRHLPQRAGSACIEELLGESLYPEGMPVGLGVLHRLALQLALRQGYAFVAKLSKHPLHVVRTGEPLTQYPEQETDNLLMIYASSVPERDEIRQAVCHILGLELRRAADIPVRRGCWVYDPILGPWQTWKVE